MPLDKEQKKMILLEEGMHAQRNGQIKSNKGMKDLYVQPTYAPKEDLCYVIQQEKDFSYVIQEEVIPNKFDPMVVESDIHKSQLPTMQSKTKLSCCFQK
jgi:hypothetical protein